MNNFVNLTYPQKSIWLTEQFYKNTSINNIVGYLKIKKNVNFEALEKAFNYLVIKNDSYKLKFKIENNVVKQSIEDFIYEKLEIIDLENNNQLAEFEKNFAQKTFEINEKNFLFNAVMLRFPDTSGILVLSTHHLISDAWSMSLTLEEIFENYNKIISGEKIDLTPNLSYLNFIKSNEEYSQSEKYQKDKEYWNEQFKELPNIISYKEKETSIVSSRKIFNFDENMINKINEFCKKYNISVYIFLLSIFGIYFRNVFSTTKFVIGNPVLNRSNFNEKHTMGMFVSVMPFLFNINDSESFIEFSNFVASCQKKMYRHIKYPYHEILNYVRKEYDFVGNLYDIVFSYQNATIPSYCKWLPNFAQAESLQIHVKNLDSSQNSLSIHYDYLIDIISDTDIEFMHDRILNMINQVLENEELKVSEFEIMSEKEKIDFFKNFNKTNCKYLNSSNIIKEFEKVVKNYPNNIAVSDKNNSLTYNELNNRANILAKKIIESKVNTDIIAFALNRNINIYVAILGILKSGHTYMPIDVDYPKDRIEFMLKNSNTQILISTNEFFEKVNYKGKLIDFAEIDFSREEKNLNIEISPNQKAYIMYTSGSTGIPKAVTIKHHNVINFISAMKKRLDYSPNKNLAVLSVTTVCFDIFVFETFPTLLSGLHLVIADELESRSPKLLNEVIIKNNISKILTTPSRIQLLFDSNEYTECLSVLKEIILGGEPFPELLLNKLKKLTNAKLINLYGPTETTVYSTFKDLTNETIITIGKPIDNTQIYILNDNNKLLPNGKIGEICIGGEGVGLGYYNNLEKTNNMFIKNPYGDDIIYKTGDLGYWNKDKELICLGRKDYQIKIRGYRVELDDICNNIIKYGNIKKCVVIDKEDKNNKKYLVAYIVQEKEINIQELKRYLIDVLPNYMIPTYFIKLEQIPLTLNHKVDRKALPEPTKNDFITEDIVLPITDTEKKIYNLIKKEFKIVKLGINIDLFDFNLDSLDIIRIQTKLLDLNIRINTQDFYKYRTIANLANLVDKKNDKDIIKYDELYLKNVNNSFFKHNKVAKFLKNTYKNILLTGANGYLGIHLLHQFINTTDAKIICIMRGKNGITAQQRLKELYKFYFNEELPITKVEVIETDITKTKFGLLDDKYAQICQNVDLVINSAANVRYYGDYEKFKKINVDLPDRLSDFCIENNIKFVHISTLGVSGNYLINLDRNYNIFGEDDFYIGQKYTENVYIQTKFEAEMLIYNKISKGLDASIIRVGNLTGRFRDGHFQANIEENAFYNILRMILKYNILPSTMLEQFLEFTPVDLCAKAISLIIQNINYLGYVFHLFNQNYLSAKSLINIIKELEYDIQILTGNEFKNEILRLSNEKSEENILKGIVNDIDENVGLTFTSTVQQKNINTNFYLDKLGFNWPNINREYIKKIIDYMKKNNYI